jgi:TRAP-type C4-dicarboxylate transport system permease small subunit
MKFNAFERALRKFDKGMSKFETFLSVGCISLCGIILLFSILNRLFFNIPLRWTEEASRMLLILTIFTAQPIVVRERAELKLAFLSEMFKGKKAEKVLNFISDFSVFAIFLTISLLYLKYTLKSMQYTQLSPAMGYPMWILYGILTLAFLDSVIRAIMVCWNDYFAKKKLFPRGGDDFSVK